MEKNKEDLQSFFYNKGYFDMKNAIHNAGILNGQDGTILDLLLNQMVNKELDAADLDNLNIFGINVANYSDQVVKEFENECFIFYYEGVKFAITKFI